MFDCEDDRRSTSGRCVGEGYANFALMGDFLDGLKYPNKLYIKHIQNFMNKISIFFICGYHLVSSSGFIWVHRPKQNKNFQSLPVNFTGGKKSFCEGEKKFLWISQDFSLIRARPSSPLICVGSILDIRKHIAKDPGFRMLESGWLMSRNGCLLWIAWEYHRLTKSHLNLDWNRFGGDSGMD